MITEAAGTMILLFSNQKLMNDASDIVNTFLTLYKKLPAIPRFIITQGLSNFLSVVPRAALQPSLDVLLSSLHSMVSNRLRKHFSTSKIFQLINFSNCELMLL